jgi:hypothetical protein
LLQAVKLLLALTLEPDQRVEKESRTRQSRSSKFQYMNLRVVVAQQLELVVQLVVPGTPNLQEQTEQLVPGELRLELYYLETLGRLQCCHLSLIDLKMIHLRQHSKMTLDLLTSFQIQHPMLCDLKNLFAPATTNLIHHQTLPHSASRACSAPL